MELMPGYKQTEVGVVPADWALISMADLFTFQNGVNADKRAYGKGTPFINVLEVITYATLTKTRIPGRILLTPETIKVFRVQAGDVLFNRTSETQDEVGLASVYIDDTEVVFGGFVIRARPRNGRFDPMFSSYALRSWPIRKQIISRGQGVVRANIGQQELSKVQAYIPPLPEQEAIAEALSDADALIESIEQLIAKKSQMKQGALQDLLTGKRRLHGFGSATSNYKQTELGVIPEDWNHSAIGDLAIKVGSGITPRGGSSKYKDYGRPFVRSQNVGRGNLLLDDLAYIDDETHNSFSATELKENDVLLNITGASIGRTALADCRVVGGNVNQHVCIIRLNPKKAAPRFINFFLLSVLGQRQIDSFQAGGNREGLNFGQIRSIKFPLPPTKAEQDAIAKVLSDADAEIAALEAKLAKTRHIKQGMMHNLLTGKIRLI
jgi:type I restriction enzyme S subunit